MSVRFLARLGRIGLAVLPAAIRAQTAHGNPITIGPTVTISSDARQFPHAESFEAVNPTNPSNLLASSLTVTDSGFGSVVYASFDGGRSWQRGVLGKENTHLAHGGDAIVYFDGRGVGYFASNDHYGLWISRSTDGGRTWGPATLLPGAHGFDRQYMGFDRTGRFKGRVYGGASITVRTFDGKDVNALAVAPSADGGATFEHPYVIQGEGKEQVFALTAIHVAPDGTVLLPFATLDLSALIAAGSTPGASEEWGFRVATSTDGGTSYAIGPSAFSTHRSTAFTIDKYGAGFASALDLSSTPTHGRLYVLWLEQNGKGNDIKVVHSSDNGTSWSLPVTVNDNTEPAGDANPAIAVNKDGVVAVVWNDRRAHSDECYDLYMSASLDGGATFLPNVKISERPTCPTAPGGNWTVEGTVVDYPTATSEGSVVRQGLNVLMVATRWPSGGDTQGLEADSDGVFHAAWIDGSSGVMQLAHTPITVRRPPSVARTTSERDVGAAVKLGAKHCAFDWTAKTFSCVMWLRNRSAEPVAGPFRIVLREMRSNLAGLTVQGADNDRTGAGAVWRIPLDGGTTTLAPGATSGTRTLTWRFTGVPDTPEYPFFLFDVESSNR